MEVFAWFEQSSLSIWVRESPLVFPTLLVVHALGMGSVVGVNVLLAWRLCARSVRATEVAVFAPFVWAGFVASSLSGALLLAAYPTKALTNPIFYLKVGLVAVGLMLFEVLRKRAAEANFATPKPRALLAATALLFVWFAAITTGRLLAYTNTVLLASHLF